MFKFFKAKNKEEDIFKFLSGEEPDKYGRNIREIWGYDEKLLERSHDYIQRLFPTNEESIFEKAPVIDLKKDKRKIENIMIKENMKKSLEIMLNFYGFEYKNTIQPKSDAKFKWISKKNHNYLRITRILTSLRIFGLEKEAKDFYNALINLSKEKDIDEISLKYWKEAMEVKYE